jgi:hypothetical protein
MIHHATAALDDQKASGRGDRRGRAGRRSDEDDEDQSMAESHS